MSGQHTDVLVLGGGTMGTAAGWAVARRGHSVRVLEQFDHVHDLGSHSGITRIFRHAYAEGADYVPWALQADEAWHALQDRDGEPFIHRVGCLDMGGPGSSHAQRARESAEAYDLEFEWLSPSDVRSRFPALNPGDDWESCFGPQGGYIEVAPALRAMAAEAVRSGGDIKTGCRVTDWSADSGAVSVESSAGRFTADTLIVAAGAWSIHTLTALGLPLEVRRKPVIWFRSDRPETISPDALPSWMVDFATHHIYGVPQVGVPGAKLGVHSGGETADPETIDRTVHAIDVDAELGPFVRRHMNHIPGDVLQSAICMYTMTPDDHFILDRHPEHANVVFGAGFSGHGFKFAPVIGEHLADLALNASMGPRPMFAMDRFGSI